MKTQGKKIRWTWQDDYRTEIAAKPADELDALLQFHDNKRVPSDRDMECAVMLRAELECREESMARSLGLA